MIINISLLYRGCCIGSTHVELAPWLAIRVLVAQWLERLTGSSGRCGFDPRLGLRNGFSNVWASRTSNDQPKYYNYNNCNYDELITTRVFLQIKVYYKRALYVVQIGGLCSRQDVMMLQIDHVSVVLLMKIVCWTNKLREWKWTDDT